MIEFVKGSSKHNICMKRFIENFAVLFMDQDILYLEYVAAGYIDWFKTCKQSWISQ